MLISVITITFNATSTIERTLQSVRSQRCEDFEYILIDGASKDKTVEIVKREYPKAQIFSEPDKGLYDAMNKGLKKAKGDYVIFLNSGDTFYNEGTLNLIATSIEKNNYPDVVYGDTLIVDQNNQELYPRKLRPPKALTDRHFRNGMLVCHQAFVPKREICPEYDLCYRFSADYDWCIRILKQTKSTCFIPQYLIRYLNEGLTTANHKASLMERFKIMALHYGFITAVIQHLKFIFVSVR